MELSANGPALGEGTLLQERYKILGVLGRGGQRRVYRALDTKGGGRGRPVVVKQMFRSRSYMQDAANAQLFQEEVKVLMQHPHPALAPIYDLFIEKGTYYLVQRFIDGPNLRDYLKAFPEGLPVPEALELTLRLAEAIDFLHRQKRPILVRDLKPSNVVLENGQPYLVDLGGVQTGGGGEVNVSTRGYSPPEGASGNHPNGDVYSLGVVLYEMLTGYDVVGNNGHLRPLSQLKPDLDPRLRRIVEKALHKSPGHRYQTVWMFRTDLEEYLACLRRPGAQVRHLARLGAEWALGLLTVSCLMLLPATRAWYSWYASGSLLDGGDLLYPVLGILALVVQGFWWHWYSGVPGLEELSRALHTKVGGVRPISALMLATLGALLLGTLAQTCLGQAP
jgi:tRNA A-37 threonylcarbamoyl transferase component Bud32